MKNKKVYDVIVIGAGPSGVSSATYTQRKGLTTLIIYDKFGGQLNYTEDIFSNVSASHGVLCSELKKRYKLALDFEKVKSKKGHVEEIIKKNNYFEIFLKNGISFISKTVIIATGRLPKKVNIPYDLNFPKKEKKEFYFTDFPYTSLKKKKRILILGGGYVGLDAAGILSKTSSKIYIIERTNNVGGNLTRENEIKSLKNISFFMENNLINVKYIDKNIVAIIKNKNGEIKELIIDAIYVAAGTRPISPKIKIEKNKDGEIKTRLTKNRCKMNMTSIDGLFACGDCVEKTEFGFEPLAVGEGIRTAKVVANYLHK